MLGAPRARFLSLRTPEALIPYILMLAAVMGGVIWDLGDRAAQPGTTITYGTADVGGPFALVDQNGSPRTERDYRGKFMLLYFGYTHCPDVCPTTLAVIADALTKLGPAADHIVPIFVTVDPARDTPSVMKAYVAAFGPRFVGLTGDTKAIAKIAREYRVYFAPAQDGGGINHTSTIYLMDARGKFVAAYDESIGPDALAAELRKKL